LKPETNTNNFFFTFVFFINFKGKSEISVASGVVIDSNAAHEFNENYIKAKSLMDLYK